MQFWNTGYIEHSAVVQVRKPSRDEDPKAPIAPCCWCGTAGSEFDLQCGACQSMVPFCIASGKRMLAAEWLECPSCRVPARRSEIAIYLAALHKCPMCGMKITEEDCMAVSDPAKQRRDSASQPAENRSHLLNA